jgi:hypothetical protein
MVSAIFFCTKDNCQKAGHLIKLKSKSPFVNRLSEKLNVIEKTNLQVLILIKKDFLPLQPE